MNAGKMMHVVKGGWVGQTFAVPTCSDSGGRKARIRRSKEERRAMVESFIHKYQNSNSGNFPSLNLTHKEVGGSFYEVREIVREIIQENRVSGPANFSSKVQSDDNVLEHYPLGLFSVKAQRSLSPSDETKNISHTLSKQNQSSGEEIVANSKGQSFGSEHQRLDSEQVVNGGIEIVKLKMIDEHSKTEAEAATDPHKGTSDKHLPNLSGQFPEPANVSQPTNEDKESIESMLSSPVSVTHPRITQEHYQETSEEQILHSIGDFPGHEHLKSDREQDVNGIRWAIGGRDEYELPVSAVALGEDILDVKKGGLTNMNHDVLAQLMRKLT